MAKVIIFIFVFSEKYIFITIIKNLNYNFSIFFIRFENGK